MEQNKKYIVGGVIVFGIVALVAWMLFLKFSDDGQTDQVPYNQEVSTGDPVDIVLDFYNPWLDAVKSTTTSPYTEGLATKGILSEGLRARLVSSEGRAETEMDPVLCQTTVPERITGRIVSEQESEARVLVISRDKTETPQSVFNLKRSNDGWFIDDILCYPGEFEAPREFSFDNEGYLLKSVPPPLDPQYWHIVFEQNGELGHTAPLFFEAKSTCIATDKSEASCNPDQFTEARKVHVYGQMTESGVAVTRLEFLE